MTGKLITVRRMLGVVNDLINEIGEVARVEGVVDRSGAEDSPGIFEER